MKALWGYSRLAFLGLLVASAFGCEELPAGTALWIRLTRPVSSFGAHRGDPVSAILTEDVECGDAIVCPAASRLEGSVVQVQKVGWGIRHETATLQIAFNRITSTSNSVAQVHAVVAEVENAREGVKKGVIYGIRSTD